MSKARDCFVRENRRVTQTFGLEMSMPAQKDIISMNDCTEFWTPPTIPCSPSGNDSYHFHLSNVFETFATEKTKKTEDK
jgi:hypothetical protein